MDGTYTKATLRAVAKGRQPLVGEFRVDAGAIDSVIPTDILHRIGVKKHGSDVLELDNGRNVIYDFGYIEIESKDKVSVGRVVFGPNGAEPVLAGSAVGEGLSGEIQRMKDISGGFEN